MSKAPSRSPLARIAIVVGVVVVIVLFIKAERYDLVAKRFHEVVPGEIYRAGRLTPASMRRVVENHHIRTVVDLGAEEPGTPEALLAAETAAELGVDRVVFDLEGDATGDPNAYVETLRIMTDPERRPVLVHCGAGTERTGCTVILYRHIVEGVPIDVAYEEAERVGHSPRRNPRLREVLDTYADDIERAFRDGGAIQVPDPESTTDHR